MLRRLEVSRQPAVSAPRRLAVPVLDRLMVGATEPGGRSSSESSAGQRHPLEGVHPAPCRRFPLVAEGFYCVHPGPSLVPLGFYGGQPGEDFYTLVELKLRLRLGLLGAGLGCFN